MKIGPRIIASELVSTGFLLLLSASVYFANVENSRLLENGLKRLAKVTLIQNDIIESQIRYSHSMQIFRKIGQVADHDLENYFAANGIRQQFDRITEVLEGLPQANRIAAQIEPNFETLKEAHLQLENSMAGGDSSDIRIAFQKWQNAQNNNEFLLKDMISMAKIRLEQDNKTINRHYRILLLFILIVLTLALMHILFVSRHFHGSIVKPLESLSKNAAEFSKGKRQLAEEVHRDDEVGLLSKNIRSMQETVIKNEIDLRVANEKLERFAAVTAHDLKSPIATGINFLDLIIAESADQIAKENSQRARKILGRTLESIDSLLALSGAKNSLSTVELNGKEVLNEVLEDLAVDIERSRTIVKFGNLGSLHADRGLLRELLKNLISNSIKYRHKNRTPVIAVTTANRKEENDEYFEILITDNGIGVGNSSVKSLLKPFSRGSQKATANVEGHGLGLAVCNEIMEAHGGRLSLEANPSGGTIARALFPIENRVNADATEPQVAVSAPLNQRQLVGKSVLLVDDDPSVRLALRLHLTRFGMQIRECENGNVALAELQKSVPDVIITDLRMPECDGEMLLEKVRQKGFLLPIVVISSDSSIAQRNGFKEQGFSDCLQKGATPTMLFRAISRSLELPFS